MSAWRESEVLRWRLADEDPVVGMREVLAELLRKRGVLCTAKATANPLGSPLPGHYCLGLFCERTRTGYCRNHSLCGGVWTSGEAFGFTRDAQCRFREAGPGLAVPGLRCASGKARRGDQRRAGDEIDWFEFDLAAQASGHGPGRATGPVRQNLG